MRDWTKESLIAQAQSILERLGTKSPRLYVCGNIGVPGRAYEDDVLSIVEWTEKGMLEIVRKENRNPVLMTCEDYGPLRYHGEFARIADHFFAL